MSVLSERVRTATGRGRRASRRRAHRLSGSGRVGLAGLTAIVLLSTVGAWLAPPAKSDSDQILTGISAAHPLGTDFAGRDNLLLLIHGGADMLLLALVAGLLITAIALAVGMAGAYAGGWIDRTLVWATDLWLTIPRFILLLVVASLVQIDSMVVLAALIAIFSWPVLARQIRAQTLSLRNREHVEAAKLLSLGRLHVLRHYLLPALAPFVAISAIQGMTQATYQQVTLAFFGVIPLTDNWGVLVSVAYQQNAIYVPAAALSLFAPVAAICLLQLCLVLISRAAEERFDPRLAAA